MRQGTREAIAEFLRMSPDLMGGKSEATKTVMKAQIELAARGHYLGVVNAALGTSAGVRSAHFSTTQASPRLVISMT